MLKYSSSSLTSEVPGNLRDFKHTEFHQKAKLAMHRNAAPLCVLAPSFSCPGCTHKGCLLKASGSLIQHPRTCSTKHTSQDLVALAAFAGYLCPKNLAILPSMEELVPSSGFRELQDIPSRSSWEKPCGI